MPHVWTYWHDDGAGLTDIRREYLNTWDQYLGPKWEIHVLTDKTLSNYVDVDLVQYKKCGFAAFSDVLRLYLLGKYGGLWLDASIVLHKPIHCIIHDLGRITVFRLKSRKYVESWFLYTPQHHRYIFRQWYTELRSVLDEWPRVCDHRVYQNVRVEVDSPVHYFMVYQSWLYLVQKNPHFANVFHMAHIIPVKWEMFVFGNKHLGACLLKTTHKTRTIYKHRHRVYNIGWIGFVFLCYFVLKRLRQSKKKPLP